MIFIHNVNDIHSDIEFIYRPRWIAPLIQNATLDHPVVILSGARQVGKSTLVQYERPFSDWRYLSLDDFDILGEAERDPAALWAGTDRVIIDEVQKVPPLFSALKKQVDKHRLRVRFVLSGSANLLLMHQVSETLAGRAAYFNLSPMTFGETNLKPAPSWLPQLFEGKIPKEQTCRSGNDLLILMLRGFMPPLITMSRNESWVRWWEGYVATYLERDLRQLSQIDSLADFRRVMEALALRTGQILNQTEISRDTGVSQPTVHRYVNLIETSCLFERLPAFARSRTKRLIKAPKVYWVDPGLVSYLSGHYDPESLRSSREIGGIFETLIFLHLRALSQLLIPRSRLYYWRTTTGKEVDFVLEQGRKLLAVEVKFSSEARYRDAEGLHLFMNEYPEAVAGVLIFAGSEIKYLHKKIVALPWHVLAGM